MQRYSREKEVGGLRDPLLKKEFGSGQQYETVTRETSIKIFLDGQDIIDPCFKIFLGNYVRVVYEKLQMPNAIKYEVLFDELRKFFDANKAVRSLTLEQMRAVLEVNETELLTKSSLENHFRQLEQNSEACPEQGKNVTQDTVVADLIELDPVRNIPDMIRF